MGLLDWFQRFTKGEQNIPLEMSADDQEFAGLDVVGVINAHLQWRKRLEDHILGRGKEELDLGTAMADNLCVLGKWIYHSPQRITFGLYPEFAELREAHRLFHLYAARVLHTFKLRGKEAAQSMIQLEFDTYSQQVQAKLAALIVRERYPNKGN